MQCQHELPEVNGATLVCIKSSEHILAEAVSIACGKHLAVHSYKLLRRKLSTRAVLQETFVPLLNGQDGEALLHVTHLNGLFTDVGGPYKIRQVII